MLDANALEAAIEAYDEGQPIEFSICDSRRMRAAITAYLEAVGGEPVQAPAVRVKGLADKLKLAEYVMTKDSFCEAERLEEGLSVVRRIRSALVEPVATPPAERVVETDWINYRPLAEGEIIQDGDECLTDSHLGWQPAANTVGSAAPDPSYTAHRMYRRPLATKPAVKDDETVVEALRGATASLVAAVSLLKRGSKKAAPSDKMFDQMILDYEKSIKEARAALAAKDGRS